MRNAQERQVQSHPNVWCLMARMILNIGHVVAPWDTQHPQQTEN